MSVSEDKRWLLDRGASAAGGLGDAIGCVRAVYDFAQDGGAVGDIPLGVKIPKGAIIRQVYLDVITTPTSGGAATVAVKAQSAADCLAATAIASVTGILAGTPVGSAATMIKLTAEREITVTVATAALTAGKFYVFVEYDLSETT